MVMQAWSFLSIQSLPLPLDIIWCNFPFQENPESPGPKSRPGLVRQTMAKDGRPYVEVCYGTSKYKKYPACSLIIANLTDLVEIGLPQATVFNLEKTAIIPWSKEWVGHLDGRGPSLGKLNQTNIERLIHLQAYLKK